MKTERSDMRYREIFEAARDGILLLNLKTGRIIDANPFMSEITGYLHEELLGKKVWELGFLKQVTANKEKFLELQQKKYVRYEKLPLETKTHELRQVEFISYVQMMGDTQVIQCNIRDISSRVLLDNINKRRDLMYLIIKRCNQVLVHESTVDDLIGEIVDLLMAEGGFCMAWVGFVPGQTDPISPIKAKGVDKGYFENLNLAHCDKENIGFVTKAMYSPKIQICQDTHTIACSLEREYAEQHGLRSAAVVPILFEKVITRVLVVYGNEINIFNSDIVDLLANISIDLAFGIAIIQTQHEYLKFLEQRKKSLDNGMRSGNYGLRDLVGF